MIPKILTNMTWKEKTSGNNRFKKLRGDVLYVPSLLFTKFSEGRQVLASKTANS